MRSIIRRRVRVTGRVQGVWYRASAQALATELGLAGWIRNCPDGSVEAVFEGPEEAVARALAWCRTGPSRARVETVEAIEEQPGGLGGFQVR